MVSQVQTRLLVLPPIVGSGKQGFARLVFESGHQELGQGTEIAVTITCKFEFISTE
jgi:hypothetical protein